jgi:hypothetical protein
MMFEKSAPLGLDYGFDVGIPRRNTTSGSSCALGQSRPASSIHKQGFLGVMKPSMDAGLGAFESHGLAAVIE